MVFELGRSSQAGMYDIIDMNVLADRNVAIPRRIERCLGLVTVTLWRV